MKRQPTSYRQLQAACRDLFMHVKEIERENLDAWLRVMNPELAAILERIDKLSGHPFGGGYEKQGRQL